MKRTHMLMAVCALVVIAFTASIATAATQNKKPKKADGTKRALRFKGPGDSGKALANKLGVTTAQLKAALKSAHESVGRPNPEEMGDASAREAHCIKLTDAVAAKLDVSGDQFRAAAKEVAKARLASDLKADRLTQEQAAQLTTRIDESKCAPLGPRVGHGGCGGPGGPRGSGGPDGPAGPHGPMRDDVGLVPVTPEGSEA